MRLTCLVVARDSILLRNLTAALIQAKIEPKLCANADDALARLRSVKFDSIMVDCVEFEQGLEVLSAVRRTPANRKTVVFAIVDEEATLHERALTGASFVLERPLHPEILQRSIRAAHSLMIAEHRRYYRYQITMHASLSRAGRDVRVDVTNVSSGGMAVQLDKAMEPGWIGMIEFVIPETHLAVHTKAELVWINSNMGAGFRFLNLPDPVREPLEQWLNQKGKEDPVEMA